MKRGESFDPIDMREKKLKRCLTRPFVEARDPNHGEAQRNRNEPKCKLNAGSPVQPSKRRVGLHPRPQKVAHQSQIPLVTRTHCKGSKRNQELQAVEVPDALDLSRIHTVTEGHVKAIGVPLRKDLGVNGVGMPELTPRWHDFGFRPLTAKEMEPSRSDIFRFAGYHGGKFGLTVAHTVGKVG